MVIIFQYIDMSDHCVIHLKLMLYVIYILIKNKSDKWKQKIKKLQIKGKRREDWSGGAFRPQCRLSGISTSPVGSPEQILA